MQLPSSEAILSNDSYDFADSGLSPDRTTYRVHAMFTINDLKAALFDGGHRHPRTISVEAPGMGELTMEVSSITISYMRIEPGEEEEVSHADEGFYRWPAFIIDALIRDPYEDVQDQDSALAYIQIYVMGEVDNDRTENHLDTDAYMQVRYER